MIWYPVFFLTKKADSNISQIDPKKADSKISQIDPNLSERFSHKKRKANDIQGFIDFST